MANVNNPNSLSSIPNNLVTPYPPSPIESQFYFYGIYSSPRLIARSSTHLWVEPRLPEAYLTPKELSPLGFHDLHAVWEDIVGPAMISYLDSNRVPCSSLDPVRIGYAGDPSPPAIIWVGVPLGSLTAEDGIKVVSDLRGILFAHSIDIHVEIRESEVTHSAKLYRPVITSNTTAQVREPFSTTVGLPISPAANPTIGGTGGFYISDSKQPGKIFLVTNRHVIFCINEEPNEFYKHATASQSRKKVLLFSDPAIQRYITDIRWGIESKEIIHQQLNRRLETANRMAEEEAIAEREDIELEMRRGENTIKALKEFLAEVSKDWKEQKNRVIGHIIMSPPIGLNIPNYGFTEDWALIELDKSKFSSTNFVGNAIDLGTTIPINELTLWMHPHPANPPSFQYPGNRLLKFYGFIPDEEMYNPAQR